MNDFEMDLNTESYGPIPDNAGMEPGNFWWLIQSLSNNNSSWNSQRSAVDTTTEFHVRCHTCFMVCIYIASDDDAPDYRGNYAHKIFKRHLHSHACQHRKLHCEVAMKLGNLPNLSRHEYSEAHAVAWMELAARHSDIE